MFVTEAGGYRIGNQVLAPLPPGSCELGDPSGVDFGAVAGDQYFTICPSTTSAGYEDQPIALRVAPNPTRRRIALQFELSRADDVSLSIYDAHGRQTRLVVVGRLSEGRQVIEWDGLDARGHTVAAGTYFARIKTSGKQATIKFVEVR